MKQFLILSTQAYGSPGGIPAVTLRTMEIVASVGEVTVISLNDDCADMTRHGRPMRARFIGTKGSRLKFVWEAMQPRRGHLGVVMHLNLAPVARLLRMLGFLDGYVCWLHGIEAWRRQTLINRWALRGADRLLSVSEYTAQRYADMNSLGRARMDVVPLGLDRDALPVVGDRDPSNALRLLAVTRMETSERYKGIESIIDAVRELHRKVALTLTIVGDGSDRARLESLAAHLPIRFAGRISDTALESEYRSCDVFVLPSSGEGFGIVFVEAMSYGKPCIGLAEGAVPEVIVHDETGLLVKRPEELAEAIKQMADDAGFRRRAGEAGARRVAERFLYPSFARRLLASLGS